jgi:hypothetical protein
MTAYRLRFDHRLAVLDALDTTQCLLISDIDAAINAYKRANRYRSTPVEGWRYAEHVSGNVYTFIATSGSAQLTIIPVTLAAAVLGAEVVVDRYAIDGNGSTTNRWERCTIVKIGSDAVAPDGSTLASSARATRPVDGRTLTLGATYTLDDAAADATQWFADSTGKPILRCNALSTVGAIGSGRALVETNTTSETFTVVDL